MQLLFDEGEEVRACKGLGLVHGRVKRLETDCKLPHIGWNSLDFRTGPRSSGGWRMGNTSILYIPTVA